MGAQLWNREARSIDERQKILKRSGGKCARCGKELSVSTMTLDHFIPFSRGGPDELDNMVALCEECNQEKKDIIVDPFDYYKYLPKIESAMLYTLKEKYANKVRWWSPKNFTQEDNVVINYSSINNIFQGHKTKNYCVGKPMKGVMKKCVYSDLDEILEFTRKYHEKVGLPTDNVKEIVQDLFTNGAIYKVMKCDQIVGIIPFGIAVSCKSGGEKSYIFAVHGIPCLYRKPENRDLLIKSLRYIMQEIALLHPQKAVLVNVEVAKNDDFGNTIVREFGKEFYEENGFNIYSVMSIFETEEEQKERMENGDESRSFYDKIKDGYSEFISDTFKIRSAERYGKEKKPKQPKKKEKRRREYDEYDIEYYQNN